MEHFVTTVGPAAGVIGYYLRLSGLPIPIAEHALPVYLGHQAASSPPGLVLAWLGLIALTIAGTTNLFILGRWLGPQRSRAALVRVLRLDRARLARIETWYRRWGWAAVMVGCHVPGARIPVLVGGGALGMRYAVFAASVAAGMAPRLALALWVGVSFGNAFAEYLDMHPSVYVVISALVALAMIGAAWRLRDAWASHPAEPVDS
jgi:membrane protein DedA with SNARE-associated domain